MYLLPKAEMSVRLGPAWAFLSGSPREFVESELQSPLPGEREHTVVMPVEAPKDVVGHAMAVGLLMHTSDAMEVGSFMFGMPADQLTAEDLRDVCMETCNVLGSCMVVSDDGRSEGVELGLPKEVSAEYFSELQQKAAVSVTFVSESKRGNRVVITVFDAIDPSVVESIK